MSVPILDQINSLDYSAAPRQEHQSSLLSEQTINSPSSSSPLKAQQDVSVSGKQNLRASRNTNKGQGKRKQKSAQTISSQIANLIGQLEKVDVKQLISDSIYGQTAAGESAKTASLNQSLPGSARISAGAITKDSANLLSITKQLVKLARNQVMGGEFGPLSGWQSTAGFMPSMLASASHMLHDAPNDFTSASLKSDWFWLVAPAVIVVGAGVIVVPVIAAWLVSHLMNQGSYSVSAGRRRKKRSLLDEQQLPLSQLFNGDLLKTLNIHQLLHDDDPQLMVDKLSRFHDALARVGSALVESSSSTANTSTNYTTKPGNKRSRDRSHI